MGWQAIVGTLFAGVDTLFNDGEAKCFRVEQMARSPDMRLLKYMFQSIPSRMHSPTLMLKDKRWTVFGYLVGPAICLQPV